MPTDIPARVIKIGRRSNQGNLRIVTAEIFNSATIRVNFIIDRLDPQESVTMGFLMGKLLQGRFVVPPSVDELADALSEYDES